MENIIDPIPAPILEKELSPERFVRKANNGSNLIYIVNQFNAPQVVKEIGRLREITFRAAGGGTGKALDLDEYDLSDNPYEQLIVWNPEEKEIVGGYRFFPGNKADVNGTHIPSLATAHLFTFSQKFIDVYLNKTIELGRSFVQPKYQPGLNNRKGLFSLDNLWDGLGALTVLYPHINYFFGKVTMYTHFNAKARDMILYFMNFYFPDPEDLISPISPLGYKTSLDDIIPLFSKEMSYKEAHAVLNQHVRALEENIPPMVNSYMNLSPTMKTFGTCINDTFGEVEETGILVTISDIYPSKKDRHILTFKPKA